MYAIVGKNDRLMVLVSRFFPWIVDMVVRRKVRGLFKDEIEARKKNHVAV